MADSAQIPAPEPRRPVTATPTPSLSAAHPVTRAVDGWLSAGYVGPDAPLIVACSGGADSLALAGAVLTATARHGQTRRRVPEQAATADPQHGDRVRSVLAAVIDHGLQDGSAQITTEAADTLRVMGFREVVTRRVTVTGDGGPEAAARAARYAALTAIADAVSTRAGQPAAVLIAHTADDQAETVLLGLARGSGPRSVAGMRPWSPPWGRPLLTVRRADTEDACRAMGVTPWRDPHNASPAFTRVRLRREVLPLLDEVLGGGVVPALARTAELMADDLAALDTFAAEALRAAETDRGDLDCRTLAARPSAVRRRALKAWVRERSGIGALTFRHLVALEEIVIHGHSRQAVRLPGAIDAVRVGTLLTIDRRLAPPPAGGPAPGREDGDTAVAGWTA
jgi:tRNA(Ile)-lysidine synthase